ncbi:PqqD family protein [Desulfopila sp. IMCC35008]|uniref:PqqD family protein n=1 Tax=Desulfopila sp. IMCC35008 TaxID=2653858 RepID=UPI0013D07567|nr:PqqD family protein [Desulfopila sp. IMCC35008]
MVKMKLDDVTIITKRTLDVKERCIDDELLLMDEQAGTIFNLNSIGAAVWRLLEQPKSPVEIIQVLAAAFPGVAKKQVEKDVYELIGKLNDMGLVFLQAER